MKQQVCISTLDIFFNSDKVKYFMKFLLINLTAKEWRVEPGKNLKSTTNSWLLVQIKSEQDNVKSIRKSY